jgi:hypothetical protein
MSYLGKWNDEGGEFKKAIWIAWIATCEGRIGLNGLQRNSLCVKIEKSLSEI